MKKPDTKAASVLFGVELETVIPAGCGVQVGNYHRGIQVTGGLRKSDGTVVTAPKFNRNAWRAEHDGSIRGSGVACEFVSPILHGEAGVAALCEFVEFMTTIGATVNDSCGCHVTVNVDSIIGSNDHAKRGEFARKLAHIAQWHARSIYGQTGAGRHTNKPPTGTERPAWQAGDFAYIGSGSAEWANWARGALAIRSLGSHDYFELRAGKRGKRLRWTEEDFVTPAYTKIIAHGSVGICWREASMEEFKAAGGSELMKLVAHRRSGPDMDEFMAIFPIGYKTEPRYGLLSADQIKKVFLDRGWQKDLYRAMCDNAEAEGLLVRIGGEGRGGQILRGLPAIAEAFLEHKQAKGSILEEVPLAKPVVRRKAKKRR